MQERLHQYAVTCAKLKLYQPRHSTYMETLYSEHFSSSNNVIFSIKRACTILNFFVRCLKSIGSTGNAMKYHYMAGAIVSLMACEMPCCRKFELLNNRLQVVL